MKDDIALTIDHSALNASLNKLMRDIAGEKVNALEISQCKNMWDVFEQLHTDHSISLKMNMYFSEWLRTISFSSAYQADERSCEATENIVEMRVEDPFDLVSMQEPTVDSVQESSLQEELIEPNVIKLPSLDTVLSEVQLPDKFLKLIKRLKNISLSHATFTVGESLRDIVAMTNDELANLPGIGKSYQETLQELKDLYQNNEFITKDDIIPDAVNLDNMRINYAGLDKEQVKALDKLERHQLLGDVKYLLELDLNQPLSLPGFGHKTLKTLDLLKQTLKREIEEIALGNIDFEAFGSILLVPREVGALSIEKFGELLLEDIDRYFDKIEVNELDIIQKRWGFIEEKQTLEEIGEEYEVTRERIRQIENIVNKRLSRNLRFTQDFIWSILKPALSLKLPEQLGDLYSCFSNERDFYNVLGIISGQEDLEEYIRPVIQPDILNGYFAESGGPVAYENVKEYLIECHLEELKNVDNAILYLEELGRIRITGENIWPLKLRKHEAAAFVLANHPSGLPWRDISIHVNAGNYSRTNLLTDRPDNSAYDDPDNIFLAGVGVYKHTRFIDFELLSMERIFDELLTFFDKTDRDVFHLNECYQDSKVLKQQDYYVIRFVVKHYGEAYGFFFDGRSQADSVGLEQGFQRITQKDVILEAMKKNKKPLTKAQMAGLLKSKSQAHVGYYLDEMLDSEQVVQVDRMLYTTPEIAYKDINLSDYLDAMENLLADKNMPVDPSVFKDVLNEKLSASYSRYFYASIARTYAQQKGWHRKYNLYSVRPIPYKNLIDAIQTHCHQNQTKEQNIIAIQQHIAISRDIAVIALSKWLRDVALEYNSNDIM
ncbi:sigma factor-like helix-turn-helix DNA-binding protein [Vibrio astriarenae]